jgi:hypothetical protein
MIRNCVALAILVALATISYAQHPSLPSSFQAKTVHSSEGADIFVRWGEPGLWSYSFMDMQRTATRGVRWHPI